MANGPKAEALKSLDHAIERLKSSVPLDGLSQRLVVGTLEYAREQVDAIQELKRARRAVGEGEAHA